MGDNPMLVNSHTGEITADTALGEHTFFRLNSGGSMVCVGGGGQQPFSHDNTILTSISGDGTFAP